MHIYIYILIHAYFAQLKIYKNFSFRSKPTSDLLPQFLNIIYFSYNTFIKKVYFLFIKYQRNNKLKCI